MPRQYLPQSDGGVYSEGSGAEGGVRGGGSDRVSPTSREELGSPIYPPAQRQLRSHGVPFDDHRARQMTRADYDAYDLLIGMDSRNLANMRRICGGDPDGKLQLLLHYTGQTHDVADPWYTDDFDAAWRDIESGCRALLAQLKK